MILNVNIPNNEYDIIIKKGIFNNIHDEISKVFKGNKIFVVTDENVNNLYGNNFSNKIVLKPGEESKSLENLEKIYDELASFNMTRSDLILALGGGVVGDIAGFAASTYLRGVPFIQIPTTILSQVDSSIGGKVAVNLSFGKNLVGSFYQPKLVLIDPDILYTLPTRYLNDGLAEVIKYGCIRDKSLFNSLSSYGDKDELFKNIENVIFTCCNIKREIVERDEKDLGERMILNFGHTIGHGIERYFNYERYTHGEAVAIGMCLITKFSEDMGLTVKGTYERIKNLLLKFNLPIDCPIDDREKLLEGIFLDKKSNSNSINLILLREIGESFIYNISKETFSHMMSNII